ncbi:MAG TPA: hypothetical protein VF101_09735 [Gaiellaceae bacterium]
MSATAALSVRQRQMRLLRKILKGIPSSHIARVEIGDPPNGNGPQGRTWLYFDIAAADDYHYVRGLWEGLVVAGLFIDASREEALPRLWGRTFTIVRANGRKIYDGSSPMYRPFRGDTTRASSHQIVSLLKQSASTVNAKLLSVSFARPLGRLAPEAVVVVNDPSAFLADRDNNVWKIVRPINAGNGRPQAEGVYLDVRDADNRWVTLSAYSVRTGTGAGLTHPKFRQPAD